VVVALVLIPTQLNSYYIFVLNSIGVFAIVGIGYNLLAGMSGLLSIGHQGFFAIGAYTAGLLALKLGLPFIFTIPAAGFITAITGLLLGFPSLRMTGFYLAISTLVFGIAVVKTLKLWKGLTFGAGGFYVPEPRLGSLVLNTDLELYYLIMGCLVLLALAARNIVKSGTARAWLAIRDNETAASCMGINIGKYKLLVFVVSAFYTGIGGALYAYLVSAINPGVFHLWMGIFFVAMVVLGGTGAPVGGAIVGSIFLYGLPELLRPLREIQYLVFGVAIILAMLFMPGGVWGAIGMLFKRFVRGNET
jgi:branched-chain amino acid transport system permease protein